MSGIFLAAGRPAAAAALTDAIDTWPHFARISRLQQAMNSDGHVLLRIAVSPARDETLIRTSLLIGIRNAELHRFRCYFTAVEPLQQTPSALRIEIAATPDRPAILLLWLQEATEQTGIELVAGDDGSLFTLGQVLGRGEWKNANADIDISASFLFDREIGKIAPGRAGIADPGDDFDVVIMADPQGGDPGDRSNGNPTRMKIHNAFIEESIYSVNQLQPVPAFVLVIGDIVDHQGQASNFRIMVDLLRRLPAPVLFSLGNHETAYNVEHPPDYTMDGYRNYFAAQHEMNGIDKLLYSFDLGQWHFIVWPDPLRPQFWERHPHYFDWLERDLHEHSARPTAFFQHIPIHPIGIDPFAHYVESIDVKRRLLELLSRSGSVRFVISGHAHIPLRASIKTAVRYRGMRMINLPAAGYRPRGFGEEEINGGPSQGFAVMRVRGSDATILHRTVTGETCAYPQAVPEFDPDRYPLWLTHKWELPAANGPADGGFEEGFHGWARRFVYSEDENPSNLCEIRPDRLAGGEPSLYLYCRKRGYDCPGQDRLPQTLNRICRAVNISGGTLPALHLAYRVDRDHHHPAAWSGAYVWLAL